MNPKAKSHHALPVAVISAGLLAAALSEPAFAANPCAARNPCAAKMANPRSKKPSRRTLVLPDRNQP